VIVHLLERHDVAQGKNVVVSIGSENSEEAIDYSVLTTTYNVGGVTGKVGILGPKRMNYAKMIPVVEHVARTIARLLSH